MYALLRKFTDKIIKQSLSTLDSILFLALDEEVYTCGGLKDIAMRDTLIRLFDLMNINSILVTIPLPPYNIILKELLKWGRSNDNKIIPKDCETRTFFHEIPIISRFESSLIYNALSKRKSVVVEDSFAIISYGTVSPEQAFVSFSSTCFSTFVKYFYDNFEYFQKKNGKDKKRLKAFEDIKRYIKPVDKEGLNILNIKPLDEGALLDMIQEAGAMLIEKQLVDSYFGNISVYLKDTVYISETSAPLDELQGAIDSVPIKGSSSVGITASSEFPTHRAIYENTNYRYLLHGHPKFSVIMSMCCEKDSCRLRDECYKSCPEKRYLCNAPIVIGEIGTGRTGIINTVPQAFKENDAVVVHGHGVFTAGVDNFYQPFQRMIEIENCAMETYFEKIKY